MPIYIFQHPETQKVIEVVQKVHDKHELIDQDGVKWDRIWTIPSASVGTKIDPYDSKSFSARFENKSHKIGDLWQESAELSEKRKSRDGVDKLKQKAFDEYRKKTGRPHPTQYRENQRKMRENLRKKGVIVED